ncbi:MAG: UPF0149 family protein [Burkholderiales bacterium]
MTEAEIDRLETLLGTPPEGANPLWLDSLQGFFAAAVSGPRPIPREKWLPVVMGGERDWANDPAVAELVGLIDRLHGDVLASLAAGAELPFLLYGNEEGTEEFDVEPWVHGYLEGVSLSDPPWDEASDGETVDELLFPLLILAGGLEDDAEWKASLAPTLADETELKARCRDSMPAAVQEGFDYWIEWRKPETIRNASPKVGRNDPCPCGSGKKYKVCHGA